jgi:hypothetical protein
MYAARSRIAAAGLCRILCELFKTAAAVSRYPGIVLFDVEFDPVRRVHPAGEFVRVSFRGANLRSSYLPALVRKGDGALVQNLILPLADSVSADADSLVGMFRFEPGMPWSPGALPPGGLVLPAQAVPAVVVDGETGRVVTTPPTRVWPPLYEARSARSVRRAGRRSFDWSQVAEGGPFETSFATSTPSDATIAQAPAAPLFRRPEAKTTSASPPSPAQLGPSARAAAATAPATAPATAAATAAAKIPAQRAAAKKTAVRKTAAKKTAAKKTP